MDVNPNSTAWHMLYGLCESTRRSMIHMERERNGAPTEKDINTIVRYIRDSIYCIMDTCKIREE